MKMGKKAIVMLLMVLILAGGSKLNVSAAGCTHTDINGKPTIYAKMWTGQYRYSSHNHTVIVGYYTNGNPITMQCHYNVQAEIWLVHCTQCDGYVSTVDLNAKESHSIVHN